jgi:hypothetical protein
LTAWAFVQKGFAVWLPFGFTENKALPFLFKGGLRLILHSGFGIMYEYENDENILTMIKRI